MPQPQPLRPAKSGVPDYLDREEADLYGQIVRAYGLASDEVSLRILAEACASLQRARLAREAVKRDGMVFKDSKGKPKPHPLLVVERDSRAAALAALKQLNLETSPRALGKKTVW